MLTPKCVFMSPRSSRANPRTSRDLVRLSKDMAPTPPPRPLHHDPPRPAPGVRPRPRPSKPMEAAWKEKGSDSGCNKEWEDGGVHSKRSRHSSDRVVPALRQTVGNGASNTWQQKPSPFHSSPGLDLSSHQAKDEQWIQLSNLPFYQQLGYSLIFASQSLNMKIQNDQLTLTVIKW